MHKWAKSMLEELKTEVESIGVHNMTSEQVCEMVHWSEVAKNIACFDKDYKIVEAMEHATEEEKMEMIGKYVG